MSPGQSKQEIQLDKSKKDQIIADKNCRGVGSLLADKFRYLETIDKQATDITIQSGQVDGFDIASGLVTAASAVAKISTAVTFKLEVDKQDFFTETHHIFLSSFQSIDDLNRESTKNKYLVKGKILGEIYLVDKPNFQELKIASKYHAFVKNGEFTEKYNHLENKDLEVIKETPVDREEIVRKYSGEILAKYLYEKFKVKNNHENISWKYNVKKEEKEYKFELLSPQKENVLIYGVDENNTKIFEAEVFSNGLAKVKKNDIPIEQLTKFVAWKNKNLQQASKQKTKSIKL